MAFDEPTRDAMIRERIEYLKAENKKKYGDAEGVFEAMKDVTSCDKLRLGANNLLVVDFRMGQPSILKVCYPKGGKPGELKHLSSRRKRK